MTSSSPNSSATRGAPSPARIGGNQGSSSMPTRARSTDEIAELPLALQAKLLHVLQDFCFSRVGGHGLINVDARVIAATNRDLEHALARGEFREDLYYRLNVVELRVPPLRERNEDIPLLVSAFLSRFNEQYGRRKELSPETLTRPPNTGGR